MKCQHYSCRCRRAEELCQMADRADALGNPRLAERLLWRALGCHFSSVDCYFERKHTQLREAIPL